MRIQVVERKGTISRGITYLSWVTYDTYQRSKLIAIPLASQCEVGWINCCGTWEFSHFSRYRDCIKQPVAATETRLPFHHDKSYNQQFTKFFRYAEDC